jgi:hypothetical protein
MECILCGDGSYVVCGENPECGETEWSLLGKLKSDIPSGSQVWVAIRNGKVRVRIELSSRLHQNWPKGSEKARMVQSQGEGPLPSS